MKHQVGTNLEASSLLTSLQSAEGVMHTTREEK